MGKGLTGRRSTTCGIRFSARTVAPTGPPAGYFRLCLTAAWAEADALTGIGFADAGEFEVVGPSAENHTCTVGSACSFVLSGAGFLSEDRVRVVLGGPSGRTCDNTVGIYEAFGVFPEVPAPEGEVSLGTPLSWHMETCGRPAMPPRTCCREGPTSRFAAHGAWGKE